MNNYSIPEIEICTLISAILIAWQNEVFLKNYKYHTTNKDLVETLLIAYKNVLTDRSLDIKKITIVISEYSKFKNNNDFNSNTIYNKKTKNDEINVLLKDFISKIEAEILPHIKESEFDILGKFYTYFIRYSWIDKKTGLVFTPTHITDFFCEIADLSVDDVVFETCYETVEDF